MTVANICLIRFKEREREKLQKAKPAAAFSEIAELSLSGEPAAAAQLQLMLLHGNCIQCIATAKAIMP